MSRREKARRKVFMAGFTITLLIMLLWLRAFGEVVIFALGVYLVLFGCLSFIVLTAFYLRLYVIEEQGVSSLISMALGGVIAFTSSVAEVFFPKDLLPPLSIGSMFAGILFFIIYMMSYRKRTGKIDQSEKRNIMAAGMLCALAAACLVANEAFGGTGFPLKVMVIIGADYFMMTQMFNYYVFVSESYVRKNENEKLSRIAYEDVLTGLYNRASWDETMSQLDKGDSDYCIISLDLDGLKAINDSKGHTAGDRLIANFATELAMSFRPPCFAARIGGDEFCVIVEDETEQEIKARLADLEKRLEELDKAERGINHRCSYGYAFSKGVANPKAHDIYLDADAKMYVMKASHKETNRVIANVFESSNESKVAQFVQEALGLFRGDKGKKGEIGDQPISKSVDEEKARIEREKRTLERREREKLRAEMKNREMAAAKAITEARNTVEDKEAKERSIARALDVLKEFENRE